jgi:hypothetical protein
MLETHMRRCLALEVMGEIEHAGTSKTMPAITDEGIPAPSDDSHEAAGPADAVAVSRTRTSKEAKAAGPADAVAVSRTRTSEEADAVAGEIAAEPTLKTYGTPGAADTIAGERGIRPITRPPIP